MRGVDHEHVDAGLAQGVGAVPCVAEEADGSAHEQTTVSGLAGQRVLLGLHEVLDGDEAAEVALVVDDRQPFALVGPEQRRGVFAADAERAGDERHRRHDLADGAGAPLRDGDETQVAVGDDAEQLVVLVDDREAGDAVLAARLVELFERGLGVDGDGVGDHARLGALDEVDLVRLVVDREVAVQDADATLARHRDGHARLGDRVHGTRKQRDPQVEAAGETDVVSTSLGMTSVSPGSSRTSSYVSPRAANLSGMPGCSMNRSYGQGPARPGRGYTNFSRSSARRFIRSA